MTMMTTKMTYLKVSSREVQNWPVLDHADKVGEAHKVLYVGHAVPVGEGQVDAVDEGDDDHCHETEQARQRKTAEIFSTLSFHFSSSLLLLGPVVLNGRDELGPVAAAGQILLHGGAQNGPVVVGHDGGGVEGGALMDVVVDVPAQGVGGLIGVVLEGGMMLQVLTSICWPISLYTIQFRNSLAAACSCSVATMPSSITCLEGEAWIS